MRADSASHRSKSSGVNGISEGCIAPPGARMAVLRRDDRLVPVVADAEVIVALAEVQRHVLMAHDRLLGQVRVPASSGIGSVHTSWCCTATSGIGTPAIAPIVGPQMPAHSSTRSHSIAALRGLDRVDPAAGRVEPGDRRRRLRTGRRRPRAVRASASTILHALAGAVAGDPVAAQHRRGVQQRRALGALRGREQLGALDPVGVREPLAALQLLHALDGGRDLEAADPEPDPLAVDLAASRRARRCPARCGTSCGTRWSGR